MSDEKALLAAIWEYPHEDTPRLVYADWLQEHGQPERAEFIRVQCELAPFGEWDESPRKAELEKREQSLWKKHGKAWRAGLPTPLKTGMFHRGFPHPPRQNVSAKQFLDFAAEKLRAAPLWSFYFNEATESELARCPESPVLAQTRELSSWVPIPAFTAEAVARLVGSPKARNLKTFSLHQKPIGDAGAVAFASSADLPNLDALYLSNTAFTDTGARRLFEWPGMERLRELGLSANSLGDASLDLIAATPFKRGLKTLLIGENRGFTTGGLIRLIESAAADSLETLSIFGSRAVTREFAEILAASPKSRSLRHLLLGNTALGDRGVAAILDSLHLQNLEQLDVTDCGLQDGQVMNQFNTRFGGFRGWRTQKPE